MARELKPCGTVAAARRHWRNGEDLCDACREAELAYQRARHGWKPFHSAACGTVSGYRRHRRNGEQACVECKAANATAKQDYLTRRATWKASA